MDRRMIWIKVTLKERKTPILICRHRRSCPSAARRWRMAAASSATGERGAATEEGNELIATGKQMGWRALGLCLHV